MSQTIENNISGIDIVNYYKYTARTVTRREFEDIISLMDSVADELSLRSQIVEEA